MPDILKNSRVRRDLNAAWSLSLIKAVFLCLAVISCTPFEPQRRNALTGAVPETFSSPTATAAPSNRWWESFGDACLNGLVTEALRANLSLKEAWARLEQARMAAVKRGATRVPDLGAAGNASVGRRKTGSSRAAVQTVESYAVGLTSQWELDLWGRRRADHEAAVLATLAARQDLNAAAVSLAAGVTSHWVGIVSQRMQKALIRRQMQTNQTLLELVELRFRKSLASALDVLQQRQVVAKTRAQLPLIEQAEHQLLNGLALLLGRTPFAVPEVQPAELKPPKGLPAAGVPAQLLVSRPDIQAALRRLEAVDWDLAAARADRLPAIRLTAGATYQADQLSLLFDNWLMNLAANLTAPLLDGGLRKAEVQRLEALVTERLAAYGRTVLTAVREVEDALVEERQLNRHITELEDQLNTARKGLKEARSRYINGLSDYLPVLTQLLAVQNLERERIQRLAEILTARVALHHALGGAWTEDLVTQTRKTPAME